MTTVARYNSVIKTLQIPLPSWVTNEEDQLRVAAYSGYDNMYDNSPDTFALAMRGTNEKPIYVPSTQRIVEATNRFLGQDWTWTVSSGSSNAADEQAAKVWLDQTYKRNRMMSKFNSYKRGMLRRGDAIFHIIAHNGKPVGQRIQIVEIHPRTYFPIEDPTNPENLMGVYIVMLMEVPDPDMPTVLRPIAVRQSYTYEPQRDGSQRVFSRLGFFEQDGWDDRYVGHQPLKPLREIPEAWNTPEMRSAIQGQLLPASITKIPVYHVVNNRTDEERWGRAEAAGMETLIAGLNQAVSDEDITLALNGIGIYVTTAKAPINEDGEEEDWIIAPGIVAEIQSGTDFKRVNGITNMEPFQQHINTLSDDIDQSAGLSAVAVGNVDAAVAASGIALRLDMAPILAKNGEKEDELKAMLDELADDLIQMWSSIDGTNLAADVSVTNTFGDPMPVDRAALVTEITTLVTQGLMSKEFAIQILKDRLGYDFPVDMMNQINAAADAEAARVQAELDLANAQHGNQQPPAPDQTGNGPAPANNLAGALG